MLIRFSVENFLSFKDRQYFSMIPGKGTLKSHHKTLPVKGVSVLKTSLIYGANASGKSNLIKAIEFGQDLVLAGTEVDERIDFRKFKLDSEYINKDSRIEYEIQHNNKNYAFGFIFNEKAVVEEWLYEITKAGEEKIYSRKVGSTEEFDLKFLYKINKSKKEQQFLEFIAQGTNENQLFITEIRKRKVKENVSDITPLLDLIDWFLNSLTVTFPDSKHEGKKFELLENIDLQHLFEQMLEYFDTGIDGIEFQIIEFSKIGLPSEIMKKIENDLTNNKSEKSSIFISNPQDDKYYFISKLGQEIIAKVLKTKHKVKGGDWELFDLSEESDGTRRIMDLIPLIIDLVKGGNVFVIDELERSLHPKLIYDLFDFYLTRCTEVGNSQLIVATHETTLLTQKLLRKDEVWFVQKDKDGASKINSLEEYKIRFDKELQKDYLLGRYLGIPNFGDRDKLTEVPN